MNSLNVLNPKQLEKQMKLLEGRIAELQKEMDHLEKMRLACQILLGNAVDFPAAPEGDVTEAKGAGRETAPKKTSSPVKTKTDPAEILAKVTDLLQGNAEGLSVEEILEQLKEQDISLKRPALEAILRKYPHVVTEAGEGVWIETRSEESPSQTAEPEAEIENENESEAAVPEETPSELV